MQYILYFDTETQELYQDAITKGQAPGNTCKIQFLGDARAGKTSLCKKLRGVQFDPYEKPTHGIGTRLCKVNNVDDVTWKDIPVKTSSTEFEETTTWFLAKQLLRKENLFESNILQATYKTIALEIMSVSVVFVVLLSLIIFLFGYSWSFCLLSSVASLLGVTTRTTSLNRVISGSALGLLFRKIILTHVWKRYIAFETGAEVGSQQLYSVMLLLLVWVILSFIFGFLVSCGLRTTMIFAILCIWVPAESYTQMTLDFQSFVNVMIMQAGTAAGLYTQFRLRNLGYQAFYRLTGRSLHTRLKQYVLFTSFAITLLCWLSIWNMPNLMLMLVLSLLGGMMIAFGIIQGRNKFTEIAKGGWYWQVIGVCTGWLLAYMCGFVLAINHLYLLTILGIMIRIGLLYLAHVVEHCIVSSNVAPIETVSDKLFQAASKGVSTLNLQKKLSLWDFAGQELYYNTHHAFMANHAVYLLVFDLTRFVDSSKRFLEYQRIHFWLQSIYTHTLAPVILVGTHADQVTQEVIEATNKILVPNLARLSLFSQYQIVSNGKAAFFAVDNSRSVLDDTSKLRKVLKDTAQQIEPMKTEYPIKWR